MWGLCRLATHSPYAAGAEESYDSKEGGNHKDTAAHIHEKDKVLHFLIRNKWQIIECRKRGREGGEEGREREREGREREREGRG